MNITRLPIADPRQLRGFSDDATRRQFAEWWEWLRRMKAYLATLSGTNITNINVAQENFLLDRFIGGNQSATGTNTNANLGELRWNTAFTAAAGTISRVASTSGHMGILRFTSANAGSHQGMYLGHTSPNGVLLDLDEMDYMEWVVRYVQGDRFRFGLGSDAGGVGLGAISVTVNANSDVSAVWTLVLSDGVSGVTVNTTIPIVANTWVTWKIQRISQAEYQFSANGNLLYTSSAADFPPAVGATIAPGIQVVRTTAGTTIGEVDTFKLRLKAAA